MTWEQLTRDITSFDKRLRNALKELRVETATKSLIIDHACVRINTVTVAGQLLEELASVGQIISSEQINGRPIHIIELNEPLQLLSRPVTGLAIPYPKPKQTYIEGWEHIEFILPGVTINTPAGVEQAFFCLFPKLSSTILMEQYEYKLSEPEAECDQLPNPTVSLKVQDVGIKFHAFPIQKVVGFTS